MKHFSRVTITTLMCSTAFIIISLMSSNAHANDKSCAVKDGYNGGASYSKTGRTGPEGETTTYTVNAVCAEGDIAMGIDRNGRLRPVHEILNSLVGGGGSPTTVPYPNPYVSASLGSGSIDDINRSIDKITDNITNITNKDKDQDGRLDGHDKDISDLRDKDKEQDGRLDGHDKDISDLRDKDKEQDGRLDGHDKDISDLRDKDKEHDGRLDGHDKDITDLRNKDIEQDNRLDGHDKDIAAINDGAVFYSRDQDGNKTGGVTLNDGTGNNVQLGNVAAGIDTKDAVNVDQLNGALAGLGGGASINDDGTVNAPTYTVGGATYNNVGDALIATNKLGVQYVADENGNPTNTVALIGDGTGKPVSITNLADGVADNDAANYGQVKDRVSYDRNENGSRSNTITLQGGNSAETVKISNLSDGVASSDAATVGQVNRGIQGLRDYTDNRLDALAGHVSDVQKEARGGIASAMAAAGLRYDDRPGKASIAGGLGGFKNAQAIAAGVGYTTENGRFRLNAAVGHSFQSNDTSWNAGASWTLN
ncbi:YadA-like family protein [Pseudochrobactrum kiredjianiae]|uniref:YadA-like family protein n=1 Tax=Pseudochrobactrum kiredjianiae TaxID=386305 RepID=UPI0025A0FA32|nr:YadA-like family protein [Pseudochrobactrum kiredjianiae]MDM7852987.1 YadA-like family protein [Pseudochrobactrum kiredjianiae]